MTTASLALAVILQNPETPLMLRFPAVYGDNVVFHYATDLWTANLKDGETRRLTTHTGSESRPFFSPDGKMIAFAGQYDGNTQVYVMPATGGQPKQLTWDTTGALPLGWTPTGEVMYGADTNSITNRHDRLYIVSPNGGMPRMNEIFEISSGSMSPDGNSIVYNRMNSFAFNWRGYRGGTQGRLSFYNFRTGEYTEMAQGREQSYHPLWVGNSVYYISDRDNNTLNLWRYDVNSKRNTRLTNNTDGDMNFPSTDGKTLVYERLGGIGVFDLATGKDSVFVPKIRGDLNSIRPTFRNFSNEIDEVALSPTGRRVVVTARGKSFSVPARSGETRMLFGKAGQRERNVTWSPDGQRIAMLSDVSGEFRIYEVPQRGGEPVEVPTPKTEYIRNFQYGPNSDMIIYVTTDYKVRMWERGSGKLTTIYDAKESLSGLDVSPDGKWVAYSIADADGPGGIFLKELATGKVTRVTNGDYADGSPSFDLSGKYLYFVSSRTFGFTPTSFEITLAQTDNQRVYAVALQADNLNPMTAPGDEEPLKDGEAGAAAPAAPAGDAGLRIDLDGIQNRVMPLPWPAGSYGTVLGVRNGVLTYTAGNLLLWDWNSRTPQVIGQGIPFPSFNADRTQMAVQQGPNVFILPVRPGNQPGQGRVDTSAVGFTWDPRAEWKQMYWEAWRYQRDEFYDKNMAGVNWQAVGNKWAQVLPYLSSRGDLNWLLGKMIGELGTGHAYVQPGINDEPVRSTPAGSLGADFEVVNGKVRFARILRGDVSSEMTVGALTRTNIKDGEYLLAINGQPVSGDSNLQQMLVGKINVPVTLTVNGSPTMDGARSVTVRPMGAESTLRYVDWVSRNREWVREQSNGQIGYIHVPDTAVGGITEFMRGFVTQAYKPALLIDERYNGGGFIPTFFVEMLSRPMATGFLPRHGEIVPLPDLANEGPKAMLINNYAGSGGDMLPWLFKNNKLGPLIGTRTWGGLVGIQGSSTFTDGGGVTAPAFGIYDRTRGQWIAENTGVDPDITVDWTPADWKAGRDPQLARGVEHLMNELRRNPPRSREGQTPQAPRVMQRGGN